VQRANDVAQDQRAAQLSQAQACRVAAERCSGQRQQRSGQRRTADARLCCDAAALRSQLRRRGGDANGHMGALMRRGRSRCSRRARWSEGEIIRTPLCSKSTPSRYAAPHAQRRAIRCCRGGDAGVIAHRQASRLDSSASHAPRRLGNSHAAPSRTCGSRRIPGPRFRRLGKRKPEDRSHRRRCEISMHRLVHPAGAAAI